MHQPSVRHALQFSSSNLPLRLWQIPPDTHRYAKMSLPMHPSIPHLLDLQDVDHRIAAVRAELDALPKKVQEADARLTAARAAVAAAKESNSASVTERKKLELDVLQWK